MDEMKIKKKDCYYYHLYGFPVAQHNLAERRVPASGDQMENEEQQV